MAKINGIQWLGAADYISLLKIDRTEEQFHSTMKMYKVPALQGFLFPLYRSLEVCAIYDVKDKCHACLKPIEKPVPGQIYCSAPLCRKAAAKGLEEIRTFIVSDSITVGIDANLLLNITKQADRIGFDLPTTVRYLLYEGIRKQGSPAL